MADFLTSLAEKTLGLTPVVQPLISPRFAPEPAFDDVLPEEETIRHEERPEDRGPDHSLRRRAAPRSDPRDVSPPHTDGERASLAGPEEYSEEEAASPETAGSPPARDSRESPASGTPDRVNRTNARPAPATRGRAEPRQSMDDTSHARRGPDEPARAGEPPPTSRELAASRSETSVPVPPEAADDRPAAPDVVPGGERSAESPAESTSLGQEGTDDERSGLPEPAASAPREDPPDEEEPRSLVSPAIEGGRGDYLADAPAGISRAGERRSEARVLRESGVAAQDGTPDSPPSQRTAEADAPLVPLRGEPAASARARSRREEFYPGRLETDGIAASQEAPIVRVSIGRVEVRATFSQPDPRPREPSLPQPRLSLEEYLRSRNGTASG